MLPPNNQGGIEMSVSKVWIEDGCTACGLCEELCPDVFEVDEIASVISGVDFDEFEDCIEEASDNCPVEVIKYD